MSDARDFRWARGKAYRYGSLTLSCGPDGMWQCESGHYAGPWRDAPKAAAMAFRKTLDREGPGDTVYLEDIEDEDGNFLEPENGDLFEDAAVAQEDIERLHYERDVRRALEPGELEPAPRAECLSARQIFEKFQRGEPLTDNEARLLAQFRSMGGSGGSSAQVAA